MQVFYNTAAGAAVLAILIALTIKVGANLEAPADAAAVPVMSVIVVPP